MGGNRTRHLLSSNEEAVTEEYTALPALCVVVIGLTLFFLLLAHAYAAYQAQSETAHSYHTAELLTEKLLDPANAFITPGGAIDLASFMQASEPLTQLQQDYSPLGFDFLFRLTANTTIVTLPADAYIPTNYIVASREVSVVLNDAQTIPGRLSVLLWRQP